MPYRTLNYLQLQRGIKDLDSSVNKSVTVSAQYMALIKRMNVRMQNDVKNGIESEHHHKNQWETFL